MKVKMKIAGYKKIMASLTKTKIKTKIIATKRKLKLKNHYSFES